MQKICFKKRILVFMITLITLCVLSTAVYAVTGFIGGPGTNMETLEDMQSFRLRHIGVEGIGFLWAEFAWDEARLAWVFNGNYLLEDPVSLGMELWLNYGDNPSPVSESLTVSADGPGLAGISFVSPNNVTYANFTSNGSLLGVNKYRFEKSGLPVGQTEFTEGEYIFTFTFDAGAPLVKSYYISGSRPMLFEITYPLHGSTGISTSPTITWEAVGAGKYEFNIRKGSNEIYNVPIYNRNDVHLSHTVPQGVLSPSTTYNLTIEALAPEVNGGHKGIKKKVFFTTAP